MFYSNKKMFLGLTRLTDSAAHRPATYLFVPETYIFCTAICSISLVALLFLNIAMLIVGALRKDECPIQERIPLYLIVAGCVGIVSKLLPFVIRKLDIRCLDILVSLLYVFEFVYTILGSVWIYSIYPPNYDPTQGDYCDKMVYLLGFWLLSLNWLFVFVAIVASCICRCITYKSQNLEGQT